MDYMEFSSKAMELQDSLTSGGGFSDCQVHKLVYILYLPLIKEIEQLKEKVKILEEPDDKE